MTSILIRCDASFSIGSGHVMRCRTLARELQRRGAVVSFLCRRQPGDLIGILEQDFAVLPLPELPLLNCQGLHGRDLYKAWLGCSQAEDAADCLQVLTSAGTGHPDWLVVDHYGLDANWETLLLQGNAGVTPPKLLVIDDLADRPHKADLLLDQNFFGDATALRYEGLLPTECRQLLGPHFALLGPEYAQLHPLASKRTELQRVLVFFGGVDPDNLTGRALEALMDPALAHLVVDVVIGRQSPHWQAVAEMVAQRPSTTLHAPLPSLAGLILRADLAIGAGGATTWERACLKLPSLVVAIAANQMPFAEALHHAGHLQLLGDTSTVSVARIRSALLARITGSLQPDAGNDLTDGLGAPRLAMAILGAERPITLRPAADGDQALLHRWANDPQLLISSLSPSLIASSDHQNWFDQSLIDYNRLLLVAMAADGCPIGKICFDRHHLSAEPASAEAVVELTLDRCARDHDLTADLVRLGLQAMEQAWGPVIQAGVDVSNSNSDGNVCFCRPPSVRKKIATISSSVSVDQSPAFPPGHITLLSDRASWINPYLSELIQALWRRGHAVRWIHNPSQLVAGDVCLLLSCGRLLSAEQIALHRHNLVVHESALPKGQGWSPMTWQILEGASHIPVSLFEAVAELDAGPIYLQRRIVMNGDELVDEWRLLQARATIKMCLEWFDGYAKIIQNASPQAGEASFYARRRPSDSLLAPKLSIEDQFNLLRVVDNDRYPAILQLKGASYKISITRI